MGALSGVRVLDLTRVLAGPYCGMLLADMGAEVIKIEVPKKGDDSRSFGPFVNGESAYYMNLNRNKKGITLNLKAEKGKEIFLDLVREADIVLENFRPGTMEKLGLGYEDLKAVNPGIIYGCVSGFGHTGPYKNRAGYDIIGQAVGGLMSTTGWPNGEATRTGTAMADILAGLSVTIGVLGALNYKFKTGIGQKVDVALVDSVVSSMEIITQIYLTSGKIPERIGNRYESVYPYDSFKALDGSLVIGCGNDKLFALLVDTMKDYKLLEDVRFLTNAKRVENNMYLKPIIEEWLKDKKVDEIVEKLLERGIPAAPINTIDKVVNDPHILSREMFVEVEHPKAGKMKLTGNHLKLSETPTTIKTPAPLLGEHLNEVLENVLGYTQDKIKGLKDENLF